MSDDNPFEIRPGTGDDLFEIAGVLVDTWRSGFRGLLADDFLDGMSREDQAVRHARRMGAPGVNYLVAVEPSEGGIVGFANFGPGRGTVPADLHEIFALYVPGRISGCGHRHRAGLDGGKALRAARGEIIVCLGPVGQSEPEIL